MLGRRDTRDAGRLRPPAWVSSAAADRQARDSAPSARSAQAPTPKCARTRSVRAAGMLLGLALLPPLLTGCLGVAVGAGAGYLVSQELEPKGQRTEALYVPMEEAWLTTKDVLSIMSTEPLQFIEFPRTAIARIDGSRVTVEVTVYDVDRTQVRVQAKRLGFPAGDTANRVLEVISSRLEEQGHGL
jgi:hypothetical protein